MSTSTSTPDFEALLQKAVDDGAVAGVVAIAQNKAGTLNYSTAIGHASLGTNPPTPMQLNTIFTLASQTKLLTSLCVLQLIDRGLITLETDVTLHLPALAAKQILTGFSSDGLTPLFTPRTKPILLRHLLTHSSGLGYSFLHPDLLKWHTITKPGAAPPPAGGPFDTVEARFDMPLLFEPGTNWQYGSSIDWAGKLVEVLTGLDLETYLTTNVLNPVGVTPGTISFHLERHPSLLARQAGMNARDPSTGRLVHAAGFAWPTGLPTDRACFGGEGAFADLSEYMKILVSLLNDDEKILSKQTAAALFSPQLKDKDPAAKAALVKNLEHPEWIVGYVPTDTNGEYDWGLGGLLVDGDSHVYRKSGFLIWGGVFNTTWFIDRKAGVCGTFGTQTLTPADPLVNPLMKAFEEAVYAKL
ncbi:beta-lactamase/transpeptidase-like protein [Podospora didyma]|uniref:Beta-lactamase/transpeptidase-like protein n=1 Tax=Podospora didyma TaxID=330526 RepID=A0AAE0U0Z1_9PEZI|nr:beta-lactamase/transpeptidase-like protein [Podospora didyma]